MRAQESPRRAQESPRRTQESPRTTRRQLGNQEEQIELHMSVGPPVLVSLTFLRHPPAPHLLFRMQGLLSES